jgi:sRNA-binding protein
MARGLLLAIVLTASACGPIVYVSEVTRRASTAVDEAKAVQADKYAPYYWTRATQYLHQAKELAAHADFQGSNRFGRLAAEAAEIAVTEAQLAAKDPSRRPLELDKKAPTTPSDGPDDEAPPMPAKGVAP